MQFLYEWLWLYSTDLCTWKIGIFVDECVYARVCVYLCMYTIEEGASAAAYPLHALTEKFKFTCKVSDEGNQSYWQTLALWATRDKTELGLHLCGSNTALYTCWQYTSWDFYV